MELHKVQLSHNNHSNSLVERAASEQTFLQRIQNNSQTDYTRIMQLVKVAGIVVLLVS